jgi:DNA-binding CsgD family transcriptional regulator
MVNEDALGHGRRAFERRAWTDACVAFAAADEHAALGLDDLERLAIAAYLAGEDSASDGAWTRAFHGCLAQGSTARAARCAFWLAFRLLNAGELPAGSGWAARARRVLVDGASPDCVEHGFVQYLDGLQAIFGGDPASAEAAFSAAADAATGFADADLVTLARAGQGRAQIYLARTSAGVALLDEAMVAITAGEVSPIIVGDTYCTVIEACTELFDVDRVRGWTSSLSAWCDAQPELVPFRGQCLVHRSEMLQLRGAWSDALDQAREACARLSQPVERPAVGAAHYQQGELHRLRGEFAKAETAYRRASTVARDPQPGLALLRLRQGRVDVARSMIHRALDEAGDGIARARLLPAAVEVLLASRDLDVAQQAAAELAETAANMRAPLLRAYAATATGTTRRASGQLASALQSLRLAATLWSDLGAPYELARVQVEIGGCCRGLGDEESAVLEIDAARAAFESLGAAPDAGCLDGVDGSGGLTPRELEVLRLVAAGKSNRDIAATLVISERTVERHMSNILARLAITSRSAAIAYAYEHNLL